MQCCDIVSLVKLGLTCSYGVSKYHKSYIFVVLIIRYISNLNNHKKVELMVNARKDFLCKL